MRLTTLVAGVVAGVAGLAGGVAGYQQLTASPRHSETVQVTEAGPARAASSSPSARVRLRDCPRGFVQKARACVREVERTVVIDVTPPASGARVAAAAAGQGRRVPGPGARTAGDDAPDDHGGRGAEHGDDHDESDDDRDEGDRDDDGDDDGEDRDDDRDDDRDEVDEDDHEDEDHEAEDVEDHEDDD